MRNHADEHEAFAASRSSEHVYVPIDDRNFTTLDKHAETIEMDAKLPLVSFMRCVAVGLHPAMNPSAFHIHTHAILDCCDTRRTRVLQVLVGEPGIGKNALLSNWVKRRGGTKHRDEFLFQYFAGASTRAKQLPHMLHKVRVE